MPFIELTAVGTTINAPEMRTMNYAHAPRRTLVNMASIVVVQESEESESRAACAVWLNDANGSVIFVLEGYESIIDVLGEADIHRAL